MTLSISTRVHSLGVYNTNAGDAKEDISIGIRYLGEVIGRLPGGIAI